jgi:hypothetical protein
MAFEYLALVFTFGLSNPAGQVQSAGSGDYRLWNGKWQFSAFCGRTAGGSPIQYSYILSMRDNDSQLSVDGWQTIRRLHIHGRVVAGRLHVLVERLGDDDVAGNDPERAGDVLFVLQKPNKNGIRGAWMKWKSPCNEKAPHMKFERLQ